MTLDEFERTVEHAVAGLPQDLRERFTVVIDEERTDAFGYFDGHFPSTIFLCYRACLGQSPMLTHVQNVLSHEIEHLLFPTYDHRHSEHSNE